MFILFFGQRFVNVQDPNTMNLLRSIYVMIALLYYQTMNGLADKIADDSTPIWIPVAEKKGIMDSLLGSSDVAPKEWKATTMKEHEQTMVKERSGGAFMKAAMPFITSQFMGIHVSILMALVTVPLDLWEDPLVRKYVLGWTTPNAYGEKYTDPTGRSAAAVTGTVTDGSTAGVAGGTARDDDYEEAIFRTWESQDPVEIPIFEQLLAVQGKDPNYGSAEQGWTAMHVVAGSPQNGRREFIRLLELGCKPSVADKDGWTALHWAAFHGNVLAAQVLCAAFGVEVATAAQGKEAKGAPKTAVPQIGDAEDLRSLLKQQDEKGRSAEQVARESAAQEKGGAEGSEDWQSACKEVAQLLEKALKKAVDVCKAQGLSEKPKKVAVTSASSAVEAGSAGAAGGASVGSQAGPGPGLVQELSRDEIRGLLAKESQQGEEPRKAREGIRHRSRGRSGSPAR